MSPTFAAGFWRLADPKITLASAASLLVGLSAAAQAGTIHWGWLLVTVFGIFAIETAKNASGEVFDWDSGTDRNIALEDRSPFSGGKRVLVDGLLTRKETWFIAAAAYVIGIGAGLSILWLREPSGLWFGLAGVALAWF
jgi:1,4-dihydroxy-2-naphthoate octaprenyltransferase